VNTKDLIRAYYDHFNANNFDAMLGLLTEDVVHDINQGIRTHGKEAFRSFMADMNRCYDENFSDLVILVSEDGTRAAAEFMIHGVYKATAEGLPPAHGQKYSLPVGCFFSIDQGKISRVTNFYNLNEWLNLVK
jgi:steroid delta-isomerase-like uncharacterized protein